MDNWLPAIITIIVIVCAAAVICAVFISSLKRASEEFSRKTEQFGEETKTGFDRMKEYTDSAVNFIKTGNADQIEQIKSSLRDSIDDFRKSNSEQSDLLRSSLRETIDEFRKSNSEQSDLLRSSLRESLDEFRKSNSDQNEQLMKSLRETIEDFRKSNSEQNENLGSALRESVDEFRKSNSEQNENLGSALRESVDEFRKSNSGQISQLQESINNRINSFRETTNESIKTLKDSNDKRLEEMKNTISCGMDSLRGDTEKKLNEIKGTVDEKLQTTLEKRISESFKNVSEQLEQVYKGLGEMQTLANDVGGLKKVLSGVKTRGILGEVQLGAILEEILTKNQYGVNVATVKDSTERVEFAVRLPGPSGDGCVWLPIDSKFPADTYEQLKNAQESGDKDAIEAASKRLISRINQEAKDIHEKYVSPPETTDFAVMFLPFEGLYSEVVNMGLIEELQRKYQVNIAGPSTMAAMLSSLQMGFRTLAIQKRSSEVWNVLSEVKTEFGKFGGILGKMKKNLDSTSKNLDELIGTRTRALERKLKDVQEIEMSDTENADIETTGKDISD